MQRMYLTAPTDSNAFMEIHMNQIKPNIVVYCCNNSAVATQEYMDQMEAEKEAKIKIARLPCSGRTDVLHMVKALEDGADMAMVVGCIEGQCQFLEGNLRAKKRVRYANRLLGEVGLGNERVRMYNLDPADERGFSGALVETIAKARQLGPWV
jgi:F420-non-reducing hydrogenase iron-sulfur subunit